MQQWPIFRNSAPASKKLPLLCSLSTPSPRVCEEPLHTLRLAVTHSRLACVVQQRSAESARPVRKMQSAKTGLGAAGDSYPLPNSFDQKLIPAPANLPDHCRQPLEWGSRFAPPEIQQPRGRPEPLYFAAPPIKALFSRAARWAAAR